MTITMDTSQLESSRNLTNKSLPQLKEMLERQEKLASNQKLLNKLPDKGTKVLQFLENLRSVVKEHQRLETNKSTSSSAQNSSILSSHKEPPSEGSASNACSSVINSAPDISDIVDGDGREVVDTAADLASCLDNLTVSELAAPRMSHGDPVKVAPKDSSQQESCFFNSYEVVMKRSAENKHKKAPFKPSSSLNISKVEDLPDALKLRSRGLSKASQSSEQAAARQEKPGILLAESAAHPPAYSFDRTREISIQESIHLQKYQKEQLEQIKSVHAAEKLAERLNIKTSTLGPDFTDMAYRTSSKADDESCDSDDVADENELDVMS